MRFVTIITCCGLSLIAACSSPQPDPSPSSTNNVTAARNGGDGGANSNNNKRDGGANNNTTPTPTPTPTGTGTPNTTPPTGKGSGTVTGKPDGKDVSVKATSAEVSDFPAIDDEPATRALTILLTDAADGACFNIPAGGASREIDLGITFSQDTKFPAAKTYALGAEASASFFATEGQEGTGSSATDGSITITEVNATHAKGTFSVTIDGNKVDGTFDAPLCASPGTK